MAANGYTAMCATIINNLHMFIRLHVVLTEKKVFAWRKASTVCDNRTKCWICGCEPRQIDKKPKDKENYYHFFLLECVSVCSFGILIHVIFVFCYHYYNGDYFIFFTFARFCLSFNLKWSRKRPTAPKKR